VKHEEARERLTDSAFIAHQLGSGGDKNFGDYLQSLGLLEGQAVTEDKVTAKEAIAKAEEILKMAGKKT